MQKLKYLEGYPLPLLEQIQTLLNKQKVGELLLKKYPAPHEIKSGKALYEYTIAMKNEYMHNAKPLNKVIYDDKINVLSHALGVHRQLSRIQGNNLKSKNEIHIASVFKKAPLDFLRMIVVHELAHFKEKEHNKAFYKLCEYMEPTYHQLEFDLRLYLTHLDLVGTLY